MKTGNISRLDAKRLLPKQPLFCIVARHMLSILQYWIGLLAAWLIN